MIIHVGDFAYNMATDNGRVGDEFMRQIEPIAAYVPYMTCVGNHEYEEDYNMSSYKAHFSMPEERYIYQNSRIDIRVEKLCTFLICPLFISDQMITLQVTCSSASMLDRFTL